MGDLVLIRGCVAGCVDQIESNFPQEGCADCLNKLLNTLYVKCIISNMYYLNLDLIQTGSLAFTET